jgi:hypothetical protein
MLKRIRSRIRGLTLADVLAEGVARSTRRAKRAFLGATDRPENTSITDVELVRLFGDKQSSDMFAAMRAGRFPSLTSGLAGPASTAETARVLFPDSAEEARREAEQIIEHRIKVFDDRFDLGEQIDWHRDPGTGQSWPFDHYTRVPVVLKQSVSPAAESKTPGRGPDVRVVWELNRLHHLTALGRAYALTGDERYTREFLSQVDSWRKSNPPRFGVNWLVAMEAAIRAVNLIAAFNLFRESPLVTDKAVSMLVKTLIEHGRFIKGNLERRRGGSSNHYLSDLIGLLAIGTTLPELTCSREWVGLSTTGLLTELRYQVLGDGVDYELATGYHRLVLEIYSLFIALTGIDRVPSWARSRIEAMFRFVRHYLKPDGTAPLVGDSDDGRLIKFTDRPAVDHSYLPSLGAVLLGVSDFKTSPSIDEEAVWWFGKEGVEMYNNLPLASGPPPSRAFSEAQIFIQRAGEPAENGLYAIIDCGDNGARGHGSHGHSDALSIEVYAYGQTLLRDPGAYVYTGSEHWRNLFRSTAYHNTARVDGLEISEPVSGWLFALGSNVKPRVLDWSSTSRRDLLDAEHDGYNRLQEPIVHRRVITLEKNEAYWVVEDSFSGEGEHCFEIFFNFDAGIEVLVNAGGRVTAQGDRSALALVPASDHNLETVLTRRWVSLSYGKFAAASGIMYRFRSTAPVSNRILLIPCAKGDESKVDRIANGRGVE